MKNNTVITNNVSISDDAIKSFARRLLPEIQKFYASDEGKKLFEQWKKENESSETKQ